MGVTGVRAAYPGDVAAVAQIQVRAWREGYRDVIPAPALAEMTGPQAQELWRERWADYWIHKTLMLVKLPAVFLNRSTPRLASWPDEDAAAYA